MGHFELVMRIRGSLLPQTLASYRLLFPEKWKPIAAVRDNEAFPGTIRVENEFAFHHTFDSGSSLAYDSSELIKALTHLYHYCEDRGENAPPEELRGTYGWVDCGTDIEVYDFNEQERMIEVHYQFYLE